MTNGIKESEMSELLVDLRQIIEGSGYRVTDFTIDSIEKRFGDKGYTKEYTKKLLDKLVDEKKLIVEKHLEMDVYIPADKENFFSEYKKYESPNLGDVIGAGAIVTAILFTILQVIEMNNMQAMINSTYSVMGIFILIIGFLQVIVGRYIIRFLNYIFRSISFIRSLFGILDSYELKVLGAIVLVTFIFILALAEVFIKVANQPEMSTEIFLVILFGSVGAGTFMWEKGRKKETTKDIFGIKANNSRAFVTKEARIIKPEKFKR